MLPWIFYLPKPLHFHVNVFSSKNTYTAWHNQLTPDTKERLQILKFSYHQIKTHAYFIANFAEIWKQVVILKKATEFDSCTGSANH